MQEVASRKVRRQNQGGKALYDWLAFMLEEKLPQGTPWE